MMEGINAFQRKGAAQAVLEVDADVGSGAEKVSKVTMRKTATAVETQAPAFETRTGRLSRFNRLDNCLYLYRRTIRHGDQIEIWTNLLGPFEAVFPTSQWT